MGKAAYWIACILVAGTAPVALAQQPDIPTDQEIFAAYCFGSLGDSARRITEKQSIPTYPSEMVQVSKVPGLPDHKARIARPAKHSDTSRRQFSR